MLPPPLLVFYPLPVYHTIIGVFIGFVCVLTTRPFLGPRAPNYKMTISLYARESGRAPHWQGASLYNVKIGISPTFWCHPLGLMQNDMENRNWGEVVGTWFLLGIYEPPVPSQQQSEKSITQNRGIVYFCIIQCLKWFLFNQNKSIKMYIKCILFWQNWMKKTQTLNNLKPLIGSIVTYLLECSCLIFPWRN